MAAREEIAIRLLPARLIPIGATTFPCPNCVHKVPPEPRPP
ncbi:MAG: DUF1610 domain-containing protein [Rhizobiales bacterium]|nr:DUF1610 domain-containing protein [Hyphomicrobiales bacterium]